MFKYRKAFLRNDGERYNAFLEAVSSGEKQLHADNLAPYEIVRSALDANRWGFNARLTDGEKAALNASWASLPDFCDNRNALAVVDTSGSMYCYDNALPAAVALSLGLYFGERNTGIFHNHFIEFSSRPQLIEIKGKTFAERLEYLCTFNEVADTNVEAVFDLILDAAVRNNVPQEELPETLYLISDMEFNACVRNASVSNFASAKRRFAEHGYRLPQIVFWNVASRNSNQPVTKNEQGVALVSGCTPRLFSMQFQKKEKRQTTVRFDSHHVRLRTGEVQRKTGSYMYRWTDKLGKRNTIYAATLEDLREQEEQILVDQHDGIKANIKNVTVNDVYELWCQLKRGIKDSTMKNYIYMYELFVKPTFGKKKLVQVKKSDVRRFYNQLIDDKVLKPSTVDVIHNIVHQVFQIAVDDDMIRSNPAANMLRENKMAHGSEIEKRKALTLEQEELFLGYLARTPKYQHWYPVFYIMANTGMRVGEITGLRWCDVDMENGIISVNHTLVYYNHRDEKGCYFSINTPKTKAGIREIPMTEGVKQAFLMEKEFQEECGMKSVSHIEGYSDFVFVNRNGEVQHQGTLNKALQRIMRDCNSEVLEKKGVDSNPALLPKFSCHVLRHTFATRMCESGLNVKVVQSVLGHADVTTTLDIYVTVTNDLKKREITAFETYLKTGAKQMANV